MGIINCTPDSFYAGNRHLGDSILPIAKKHIDDGAKILDIGGQSTRPGSARISAEEEAERVSAAIRVIRAAYPDIFISVDTFYSAVAEKAVEVGADIINDVTGASIDPLILEVAGRMQVPYILTHLKGDLNTMQANPQYENLIKEILSYFIEKIRACEQSGIKDIIVDLGFGFGKTLEHNYKILSELQVFHTLNRPILAGVSRKSMIQKLLQVDASAALNGTTIVHTHAIHKGAHLLRVHDVKEAMEVIKIQEMIGT